MKVFKKFLMVPVAVIALSSSVFSMDRMINDPTMAHVPPVITVAQYIDTIAHGGSIGGWGDVIGDVRDCIQSSALLKWFPNWRDLPLFRSKLFSYVEGDRFRCDYWFPSTFGSYNKNGELPAISLFRKVTPEEIRYNKLLNERSSPKDYHFDDRRFREWNEAVNKMISEDVASTLLEGFSLKADVLYFPNIIKEGFQKDWTYTIRADRQDKGNKKNLCCLYIDDIKFKYLSKLSSASVVFDTSDSCLTKLPVGFLLMGHPANVYFGDENFNYNRDGDIHLSDTMFDINGELAFGAKGNIKLERVLIRPVGYFTILSKNENSPIKKIRITSANSTEPMLLSADLTLSENPRVMIECLNAARIEIKFREIKYTCD